MSNTGSTTSLDKRNSEDSSRHGSSVPDLGGAAVEKGQHAQVSSEDALIYDQGWTCWSQVLVSFLLVVNGFGYISSFGIFQALWTDILGRTASDVAWAGSLQIFLLFFVGTLSGRAMDAGYFKMLILVGCGLQLLGTFTTSAVTQYWQLILTQGIVNGLGNGLLFTPAVTLVSLFFKKRRAFALSIAATGAPVGGVIFPIIAQQLEPRVGHQWAIRVMGFVMLFNSALIIVLARPRPSNRVKGPLVEWSAFRELPYLLFTIGMFFVLLGLYFAYFYTSTYGQHVMGLSPYQSLIQLMILNAVGVPGRMIPALLADAYWGPLNTLLPFLFISGIMLLCWMAVSTVGGFYTFVILYGISANAVQTLFPSSLSGLTTDMSKMGTRIGMNFTIMGIACLAGPPIAGALIAAGDGSYRYAQIFGGVVVLFGACIVTASRIAQKKEQR